MFKKMGMALGVAAVLGAAAPAMAGITLPTGIGILEDDNIEYVTDVDGNVKTSGTLVVGDTLHAVIGFTKVLDGGNNDVQNLGAPGQELTGISAIEVASVVGNTITFKPSAAFEATYGAGAMAALFEQSPGDFDTACNAGGVAGCETTATNGNPWMVAGFGDADDFWFAAGALPVDLGALDLSSIAGLAATTKVGAANYALSILVNNTGFTFNQQFNPLSVFAAGGGDDLMVDIIGSGDVLGGAGLGTPWIARSDFDFQVDRVPTPATLALLGLGLAGLGYSRKTKKA